MTILTYQTRKFNFLNVLKLQKTSNNKLMKKNYGTLVKAEMVSLKILILSGNLFGDLKSMTSRNMN